VTSVGFTKLKAPNYEVNDDVSESFRIGRLERKLHMVQLSATRCSCTPILWVSLVSFTSITLYVASQRFFGYTLMDLSVGKAKLAELWW